MAYCGTLSLSFQACWACSTPSTNLPVCRSRSLRSARYPSFVGASLTTFFTTSTASSTFCALRHFCASCNSSWMSFSASRAWRRAPADTTSEPATATTRTEKCLMLHLHFQLAGTTRGGRSSRVRDRIGEPLAHHLHRRRQSLVELLVAEQRKQLHADPLRILLVHHGAGLGAGDLGAQVRGLTADQHIKPVEVLRLDALLRPLLEEPGPLGHVHRLDL